MGTRTGNAPWMNGEDGGTPVTATKLEAIEAALDDSPTLDQLAGKADASDLTSKADLVAGKVPLAQLPDDIGGGGTGDVTWVSYTGSAWPARPDVPHVQWIGGTSETPPPANVDDIWVRPAELS